MFDNKWQKKEMPLVSLIGMGGGIASPAFLASIVLNILKPTVFSPIDDTGVPDFDYTAESSAITNVDQIQGGWSSASFDSNGNNNQWQSVAYGNGKYVALGKTGNAYLAANSTDGINWTSYSTIPYTGYSELAYGNGAFVAVGNGKIVYSTNEGASWSSASVSSNWWQGVTYGDGKFVAVSEDGTNRVATSSDGVNWSETSAPGNYMWLAVTYGGGKYVAVSQQGDAMYSSDGTNWSTTSVPETGVWNSVAYGNGKFVAVAGTKVIYSTDGINWSSGNNTIGYWKDITFGDGKFVAVSNYQDSSYPAVAGHSTDGDTWTPSNQATSGVWYGVDYVNGRFIAVAGTSTPKIMWSPTGVDEATQLTLTDTTVSKVSDGSLIGGTSIDQVLTVGETVQADTAVTSTVTAPVFSATTYTGNGSSITVPTGVDLSGKSLVWSKPRNSGDHRLFSSEGDCLLSSTVTNGKLNGTFPLSDYITFGTDSYTHVNNNSAANNSGVTYSSWNFRTAPGFFDVVTYTGDGNWQKTISHNLGSVPAFVIIKRTDSSSNWMVGHAFDGGNNWSSTSADFAHNALTLNSTGSSTTDSSYVGCKDATSTAFTVYQGNSPASNYGPNHNNATYVAYLFANTPGLIKCGSYTGTGSSQTIDTGFKPEFVITKSRSHSSDWYLMDSENPGKALYANGITGPQTVPIGYVNNGFTVDGANFALNTSGYEYIYLAIAENPEVDITGDFYATGTVSASSGNAITLSNTTGTWSTGMKVQGVTTDTKDNPDPIKVEDVSLTSSAPTAERNVSTWGDAIWEVATDENFTQNVQTATTALSATGTQAGPSFVFEKDTGYYTRTKYTALGQESEWSDVTYFLTKGASFWETRMRANQRNETTEANSTSVDDGYVYIFGRSRAFSSANSYSRPIIIKKDMEGQTIWKKYFDTGNDYYAGFYAGKVKNGYIYAAGECPSSIGNSDPWLVKLDTDGNVEWQMNYGHSGQTTANRWYSVDVDNYGNVYTAGRYKEHNSGQGTDRTQAILAKWNSSGTLQWQRRFTSPAWTNNPNGINLYTNGYGVALDTYGNPYMIGDGFATSSTNNFLSGFIVKFNSSGTYQWGKYYDNADNDGYTGITIDSFNRIFVCGRWARDGYGGSGVVAYYSTNGYLNWRRDMQAHINGGYDNGGTSRGLSLRSITSDNSGNAYVGGSVNLENTHGSYYSIFAKIDSSGNLVWKGELTNSEWEHGYLTPERANGLHMGDGGLIVGGTTSIADGGTATRDMVHLRLPSDAPLIGNYGNFTGINESTIQWNTTVPGAHSSLSSSDFNTPPFTTAPSSFNIYNISSGTWDDTVTIIEV